jgi:hypothetical protein
MSLSDNDLVQAVFTRNTERVRSLIASKADVNAVDTVQNTPLAVAAYHGDVELTFMLLDAGAAVNSRDPGGATALIVAAKQGHGDVARLLVAHGADQKAIDRGSGATALMLAKQRGDEDLVSLLDPSAASARQSLVEEEEEDDEPELPSELILTGNVMAIDHVLKLDAALERFDWGRYEAALAKLAGVRAVDVFVTPEPGSVCVEAHATILVRLPGSKTMRAAPTSTPTASTSNSSIRGVMAATGGLGGKTMSSLAGGTLRATGGGAGALSAGSSALSSSLVDRVMGVMQALKKAPALKQATGGAVLVGTPQVRLLGDVATEDALVLEAAQELLSLRPQHDLARQIFESRRREVKAAAAGGADGKAAGGADASGALALEASKAILLLRGPREALQEAAERAAAAKERRTKRR